MMLKEFGRRETGLLEQFCEHGIGHPTLASAKEVARRYGHPVETWLTHGCDGCCQSGMEDDKT